jgi:hypothetical protein
MRGRISTEHSAINNKPHSLSFLTRFGESSSSPACGRFTPKPFHKSREVDRTDTLESGIIDLLGIRRVVAIE